jgi:aryl-alcohol dehydrogenase-like predicted oxidoreductase
MATIVNETRMELGKTGLEVSRLGIGAMTWGDPSVAPRYNPARMAYGPANDKDELQRAIDSSISHGVSFIDTAAYYGKGASELLVGELIKGRDVFVATKFPSKVVTKTSNFPEDLENSLKRLDLPCIDLYQIHYPSPFFSVPKVLKMMAEAVHSGKIKSVGVSNFSAKQTREAHQLLSGLGISLASNQVEYSLLHKHSERNGLLEACNELNITLIAYMPFKMGALTGKYLGGKRPQGLRKYMRLFRKREYPKLQQLVGLMGEMGSGYDKSPAQVALRWLIQKGNVLPIPGAKNSDQVIHNAGALTFSLSDTEMEALEKASEGIRSYL